MKNTHKYLLKQCFIEASRRHALMLHSDFCMYSINKHASQLVFLTVYNNFYREMSKRLDTKTFFTAYKTSLLPFKR